MGKYLRKYGIVAGTEKKKGETTDPDLLVPAESASQQKISSESAKGIHVMASVAACPCK